MTDAVSEAEQFVIDGAAKIDAALAPIVGQLKTRAGVIYASDMAAVIAATSSGLKALLSHLAGPPVEATPVVTPRDETSDTLADGSPAPHMIPEPPASEIPPPPPPAAPEEVPAP